MISVLIPVFNTDVRNLVSALAKQIDPALQEIIVLDDGSDESTLKINAEIGGAPGMKYYQNRHNTGRIHARNRLASLASNDWLLFLDADSGIQDEHFIKNYSDSIDPVTAVIVGGRLYEPSRPLMCEYALHWKYGSQREIRWRTEKDNVKGFQSSNFLIRRSVFMLMDFPEDLTGYGHEDTWMGIQLEKSAYGIRHINNAVLHLGLEIADQFIDKSEQALKNLVVLRQYCDGKTLSAHARLYKKYLLLRKTGGIRLVKMFYWLFEKTIHKNIRSCNPDLLLFDVYRLVCFSRLNAAQG